MQVAAVCQENTDLRAFVSALEEEKAACEAGARANRETILRMVAEAKAYETTLDKMSTLKQVCGIEYCCSMHGVVMHTCTRCLPSCRSEMLL